MGTVGITVISRRPWTGEMTCNRRILCCISPYQEAIAMIKIDRYDARIVNGTISYFAIAGEKEYPMPECYKEMYDEDHLAIEEVKLERPELFDAPAQHYIPLRTVL